MNPWFTQWPQDVAGRRSVIRPGAPVKPGPMKTVEKVLREGNYPAKFLQIIPFTTGDILPGRQEEIAIQLDEDFPYRLDALQALAAGFPHAASFCELLVDLPSGRRLTRTPASLTSFTGTQGGKAFVRNARFASEYSWARMASAAPPTLYVNLNAPYGSTVAGHTAAPKDCTNAPSATVSTGFTQTTASTGTSAYPEPSTCEAYNYGWNAAADAYAYAKSNSVYDTFWWLDIEEANSWSANPAVNDATIQGALDYLNGRGLKAGIYSVPYMWKEIAGDSFIPTERVNGAAFPVPTWFPIGINTQVGATNACATKTSFIKGSPIWILQYELDHTAIDQNIAC